MDSDNKAICGRIKMLRNSKKYSQEKLADMAGITRSSLANYEQNRRPIPIKVLVSIAKALDCSVAYLINGVDDKENEPDIMMIEKFDSITNDFQRKFVKAILNTSEEDLEVLERFFDKIKDG